MESFPTYALLMFDGFQEEPESAVGRTEMEKGPPKQAQTRSRVMVPRPVRYLIGSKEDLEAFKAWFKSIGRGAAWFWWTDPVDGAIKRARIVQGKITYVPRVSTLRSWNAVFSLETWE